MGSASGTSTLRGKLAMLALLGVATLLAQSAQGQSLASARTEGASAPTVDIAPWLDAKFGVLTTQLSPATLIHSTASSLGLFANMQAWGLGTATHVAVPTARGIVIARSDQALPTAMTEPWLLCWFNGASNWQFWDMPVLVVLQHRPTAMTLDKTGLSLQFAGEAGLVVVLPLYGYEKMPLTQETDFLRYHGLPSRGLHTDTWGTGLPASVVEHCRLLARVLRAYPVHCRETFALDGDDLVIQEVFQWVMIEDDWKTAPLQMAPLPPTLALAWWAGQQVAEKPFPMSVSRPVRDLDVMTAFGPWVGVAGVEQYTLRLPVLPYVQFTEQPTPGAQVRQAAKPVLERLQRRMAEKFTTGDWQQIWDHELDRDYGGPGLYCWQVMNDRWYAKALPYITDPTTREHMIQTLGGYLENWILDPSHYQPYKDMLLLEGPGIQRSNGMSEGGKFSSNLLDTIWHIAYYADQWQTIRDHWAMLQRFFVTPLECDWRSMGRYAIAELGDEAGPPLAYARLAYQVGDMDSYAFGCYVFGRELVHHYVKQVATDYFRLHQPYDSAELIPTDTWPTNLWGGVIGWRIDGPTYPAKTQEAQSANRWVRFSSYEVARFYRDYLADEVSAEISALTDEALAQGDENVRYKLLVDTAHITPSLVRLRAMLMGESAEQLLRLAPLDRWQVYRGADVAAMCVPTLRNAAPIERVRIIPAMKTDFALGLQRLDISGTGPALTTVVRVPEGERLYEPMRGYPAIVWQTWRSPLPVRGWQEGRNWSLGQIVPGGFQPASHTMQRVSWTTAAWIFSDEPAAGAEAAK